MINTDKLHQIVEAIQHKNIKHTTLYSKSWFCVAYSYLMLGEIWSGDHNQTYLYVSSTGHIDDQLDFFCVDILNNEPDITYERFDDRVLIRDTGQLFIFLDASTIEFELDIKGVDRVFLNVPRSQISATFVNVIRNVRKPGADII